MYLPTTWMDTVASQESKYLLCPQKAEELLLFSSLLLQLIILFHLLLLVDHPIDEISLKIWIFHDSSLNNGKLVKSPTNYTSESIAVNTAVGANVHIQKATEGVRMLASINPVTINTFLVSYCVPKPATGVIDKTAALRFCQSCKTLIGIPSNSNYSFTLGKKIHSLKK